MATLNVSFRCVDNIKRIVDEGTLHYTNNLYEGNVQIACPQDTKITAEFIKKAIRKNLKSLNISKKVHNSDIIITYMWDEYQLAENRSL